jgi:hypothetical protein
MHQMSPDSADADKPKEDCDEARPCAQAQCDPDRNAAQSAGRDTMG